jgi:hypothetical protein
MPADEETEFLAGLVARRRQIVERSPPKANAAAALPTSASGKRLIKSIARVKKALEAELAELRRICSPRFPASVRSLRAP